MLSLKDILNEHNYAYTLIDEYYKHIDRYKNQSYDSIPVRYMSINLELSTYDKNLDSVYQITDKLLNGLVFDIYELVPTKYSSPISPQLFENEQFTGLDFNIPPVSITLIGTLTSDKIHLNDLVQFYSDYFNKMIFQVFNIRTPLITNFKVPIFELDLTNTSIEPDKLYDKIRVNEIYIYDISQEKFVEYEKYQTKYNLIDFLENYLAPLLNQFFDSSAELYYYEPNYYPKEINELIYNLINDVNNNYFRLYNIKIPTRVNSLQLPPDITIDNTTINIFTITNPLNFRIQYYKTINLDISTILDYTKIDTYISDITELQNYIDTLLITYQNDKLTQLYILAKTLDYIVRNYVYL